MHLDYVTRPVYEPLDCSLVDLTRFSCPRLSVKLDPDRGVVDRRFLCLYGSDIVVLLWRASQEAVLPRSGCVLGS